MPASPYQTLGIPETASTTLVKKAYRKHARLYHPDRNGGDKQAEQRFREVQAAYELLSDERARAAYDAAERRRRAPLEPPPVSRPAPGRAPAGGRQRSGGQWDEIIAEQLRHENEIIAEQLRHEDQLDDDEPPEQPPQPPPFRDSVVAVSWVRFACVYAAAAGGAVALHFPAWATFGLPLAAVGAQLLRGRRRPYRIALAAIWAGFFAEATADFRTPYSLDFRFGAAFVVLSAALFWWGAMTDSLFS